jgi:BirA family biotin operon repressor/biotin-[acetyl-CoA-carboxylase] ligase
VNPFEQAAGLELFLRVLTVRAKVPWLDRAVVLAECESTQDEALRRSGGKPGLVVGAMSQTAGRGRLGRTWVQRPGLGLALTFVLDPTKFEAPGLAIRIGCAVCELDARLGIKWPNDVVFRAEPKSKVAGVLSEKREGVLLLGVGINVLQEDADWPAELRGRAMSLSQVGVKESLESVTERLIAAMDRWLVADRRDAFAAFRARDVLTGTAQTVQHDGKRYSGTIEAIDPEEKITLRTREGLVDLPALSSSLVKD